MRIAALVLFLLLGSLAPAAATPPALPAVQVESTLLGDSDEGTVIRLSFRYDLPPVAPESEVTLSGSVSGSGGVVRRIRISLRPEELHSTSTIVTLPHGTYDVETRLLVETDEVSPTIVAKSVSSITVAAAGKPYVPTDDASAEAIVAKGVTAESTGAIRIRPPRRDLAPNLFIVDVDADAVVKRVEFFVGEKKIFTKNAPPWRAELDIGSVPRRVEIRAVAYDAAGRYVDADAWIVNERENPLEVKITRTRTAAGLSHVKVSVQSAAGRSMKTVELFVGDREVASWNEPPYALSLSDEQLKGGDFLRATAIDSEGIEASDILFLDGRRFAEAIEVNLVELPVSVINPAGAAVADMIQSEFEVLEEGKRQKISSFAFATGLPLTVGVLVDHSGSMKARLDDARKAAITFFTQTLTPRDRAFFGGFSWEATRISPLTSDVPSLQRQVDGMPEGEGATALYDAIISGLYQFRGVEGRKALLIVTDGDDTASRVDYDRMLTYIRTARVPLYFIGIGLSPFGGGGKLRSLAAETGGVAYFVKNAEELPATYEQLGRELRSQYVIGYYTGGGGGGKYRTVEVRSSRPQTKVRTIRGFLP